MKVQLLTSMVRVMPDKTHASFSPGDTIDVPDREAADLIDGGLAIPLDTEPPKAKAKKKG